jgi:mono/diheme cytochrome c family protein
MRGVWKVLAACLAVVWLGAVAGVSAQVKVGGDPKAAAVKNPQAANAQSITKGRSTYNRSCRHCHGLRGKGDGPLAPKNPKPADLTDAEWKYGATDGDLFNIIANGVGGTSEMKGVRSEVPTADMWHVVNYLRSIGPKK